MVSSASGPAPPAVRSGRVGPPMGGGSVEAGGAAGGGCHAGISVVASCALGAAIVSATSGMCWAGGAGAWGGIDGPGACQGGGGGGGGAA